MVQAKNNLGSIESVFVYLGIEYTLYSAFITALTVFVTVLQMVKHWVFAQGNYKLTYIMNIVALLGFTLLTISISMHTPTQKSLFLFIIMNGWGIFQNTKGLLRLREAERTREKHV